MYSQLPNLYLRILKTSSSAEHVVRPVGDGLHGLEVCAVAGVVVGLLDEVRSPGTTEKLQQAAGRKLDAGRAGRKHGAVLRSQEEGSALSSHVLLKLLLCLVAFA